jgi:MscS family membrane protein
METIRQLFDETFKDISLGRVAAALGLLLLALLGKKLAGQLFIRVLQPVAAKTRHQYDDRVLEALRKPVEFLVIIVGLFFCQQILQLPSEPINLDRFATAVLKLLVTFDIGWALFNLIGVLDLWFSSWASKTESTLDDHLLPFVRKSLRAFVILMAIIMAIQNLGYSISGLLASLGIGGLAFALAAKDTLSNVFGSLMILLDRPFRIGDWIKAGDMEGTVEEIGFRSTKIRTFAKTLISVPNNVIANLPLDNFSRMPKRRIKLTVGVTYATSAGQMSSAVAKIRDLLRQHPAIDQEFWLVNFTDFGSSSLDIMVYCFTTTTVWGDYLDARQDLNLKIMQLLEGMGLEIAFPSRTVYLQHKDTDMQPAASATPESESN